MSFSFVLYFEVYESIIELFRPLVLNLLSLRTGKLSEQILRTGGLSKSTQNVITVRQKYAIQKKYEKFNLMRSLLLSV